MSVCPPCGAPTTPAAVCQQCRYAQPRLTALRAVSEYREPLRACIHALKYDGNKRVAEPPGLLLAWAYRRYDIPAAMLVPVPLHQERYAQRGYHHAALLAAACARHLHLPCYEHLLVRQRATATEPGSSVFASGGGMALPYETDGVAEAA